MVKDLIPNGLHGLYDRQNRIEGLVVPKKVLVVNPTEELLLGLVMVGVEELYLYQFGYIEEYINLKKLRPYLNIINIRNRWDDYTYNKIKECIVNNNIDKVIYNINNSVPNSFVELFNTLDSESKTYILDNQKCYYNVGKFNTDIVIRSYTNAISIYLLLHTMFYEKDFEHYYTNNISFSIDSDFVIDRIINDVKKNFEFIKKRNNFGDISIDFDKKIEREYYDSTYHIIGAGGIGYNVKDVVKNNYTKTYDTDKIELSNLSRLPLSINYVCKYKAINRQEILGLNYLSDDEELSNYSDEKDVVIDCRDNLNPRKLHRKTAFKLSYDGGKMFGIYLRPQDTLVDSIQFNQTSVTEDTYTTDPSYFIMPRLLSFIGLELLEYDFIKNTNKDEYKNYKISMNLIYNLSDIIKENITVL